jgi:hypothetical protein
MLSVTLGDQTIEQLSQVCLRCQVAIAEYREICTDLRAGDYRARLLDRTAVRCARVMLSSSHEVRFGSECP